MKQYIRMMFARREDKYICLTKVSCIPFSLLLELVRKLLARHSYWICTLQGQSGRLSKAEKPVCHEVACKKKHSEIHRVGGPGTQKSDATRQNIQGMFDQGELHPFFTLAGACKEVVGAPQLLNMHIARPKWQTVESWKASVPWSGLQKETFRNP